MYDGGGVGVKVFLDYVASFASVHRSYIPKHFRTLLLYKAVMGSMWVCWTIVLQDHAVEHDGTQIVFLTTVCARLYKWYPARYRSPCRSPFKLLYTYFFRFLCHHLILRWLRRKKSQLLRNAISHWRHINLLYITWEIAVERSAKWLSAGLPYDIRTHRRPELKRLNLSDQRRRQVWLDTVIIHNQRLVI
jgi:hypothetical protein